MKRQIIIKNMKIGESVAINYIVKLIVNVVLDFSQKT